VVGRFDVRLSEPMEVHVLWGLVIPVIFLLFTGLVKSLVKKEFLWSNFYLGVDATLAALANGVVNIVDGVHETERSKDASAAFAGHMFYTACFLTASIGALLLVMAVHQRFEVEGGGNSRMLRGIFLGGVSNILGAGLLGAYIFMKLRGLI
jgi:hypothetical protein